MNQIRLYNYLGPIVHSLSELRILMLCEVGYFCQPNPIISAKKTNLGSIILHQSDNFSCLPEIIFKRRFQSFFWLSTRSLKAVIILLSACPYLITVIEAKLSAAVSTECTLTVFVISMKNIQSLILLERILSGFAECPILCASPIAIICQGTHTATDPIT